MWSSLFDWFIARKWENVNVLSELAESTKGKRKEATKLNMIYNVNFSKNIALALLTNS